jgi:hypothetical protein
MTSDSTDNARRVPTRQATLQSAALLACLPDRMHDPSIVITRIAAGMSGAGVYRVRSTDAEYALKITASDEPVSAWRIRLDVQRAAGVAGVAPVVVHADETRRAVLSEYVAEAGFHPWYRSPATHEAAVDGIATMLRVVHSLPVPTGLPAADPMAVVERLAGAIAGDIAGAHTVPPFVIQAIAALRHDSGSHVLPLHHATGETRLVPSHNDVNPSNLVFDGVRVLLLDWQTPALNDPYYDLATVALFLRMEPRSVQRLLTSYSGTAPHEIPPRFTILRRTAALLSGMASMQVALQGGHPGSFEPHASHDAPALGDVYAAMRSGALQLGTPAGQWTFGLALVRESM